MNDAHILKDSTLINWILDFGGLTSANHLSTQPMDSITRKQAVERIYKTARNQAIASGVASGLVPGPLTVLPAATLDLATTLKIQLSTAAKAALMYDPKYFEKTDAKWALARCVLNIDESFLTGTPKPPERLKQAIIKWIGLRVAKKSVLTKTVPILGSVVGGGLNAMNMQQTQKRVIAFLDSQYPP